MAMSHFSGGAVACHRPAGRKRRGRSKPQSCAWFLVYSKCHFDQTQTLPCLFPRFHILSERSTIIFSAWSATETRNRQPGERIYIWHSLCRHCNAYWMPRCRSVQSLCRHIFTKRRKTAAAGRALLCSSFCDSTDQYPPSALND